MSAIRKFFEKKKLKSKFKLAGAGQQLNAPTSRQVPTTSRSASRCPTTASSQQAGQAALARFEVQQSQASKMPQSSSTCWKQKSESGMGSSREGDQVNVEVESTNSSGYYPNKSHVDEEILFSCPMCPVVLPREEIYVHLHECFNNELGAEPLMISVTMIYTLNRDKEKVDIGINVLCKYLQNIIDNPNNEKYRKIRKTNKAFQEKVATLIGVDTFLINGCGFEVEKHQFEVQGEIGEHEFYVMSKTLAQNAEQLLVAKQMLVDAEPLVITIDRNMKVFKASASANHIEVPSSFFEVSAAEAKQHQTQMTEELEKSKQLRTKAMREGETASKRVYKYCIIRIRFPDGILLQGCFSSYEKLSDLKEFIKEQLNMDWLPFNLVDSIGRPYVGDSATLTKLKLSPATLVNFTIEANISEEIAVSAPGGRIQYLSDETMALIQVLP